MPSRLFVFGSVGRFRVRISADSEFVFLVVMFTFVSSGKMATAVLCSPGNILFSIASRIAMQVTAIANQ